MSKPIICESWLLECTTNQSQKFYHVTTTENGYVFLRWGRIGTSGQHKVEKVSTYELATDLALRQVYAKRSKGYRQKYGPMKFETTDDSILRAKNGNLAYLLDSEIRSRDTGFFEGEKKAVLKHYEDFSRQVQSFIRFNQSEGSDSLYEDFERLEKEWAELSDKHAEVEAAFGLAKATLLKNLIGS